MTTQIVKPINKLLNAASMNIFARAYLLRRLLDIYGLASEFHLMAVNSPNLFLDHTAQKLYGQWYTPTVSAENPSTVKKLNGFFKEFSPNKLKSSVDHAVMLHKLALSRGLTPGGIVLASNNNQYKLHWFKGQQNISELWFYQTGAPVGWVALNKKEHVDKKSGLLINHQLKLIHGAVFFVPFDGRNTAALAREIKQQAAEKNITDISWPETWPVNQR